jgi:flagellar FliL protein
MADEKEKEKAPPAAATPPADAKDAKKEGSDKAGTEAAPKKTSVSPGGNWLPLVVVILITPILAIVVSDNIMIPRVKKALGEIAAIEQAAAHPAAGGPLPTEQKDSKEKAKDAKGVMADQSVVKFENVVANLSGTLKSRFVKVSFSIEGDSDDFKSQIEPNKDKIIDAALGVLGALTVAELDEPGTKNIVRSDLIDSFNQVLAKPIVKRLYFSEFVIQ